MKKRWVCRLVVWSLSVCLASCSISRNIKTSHFIEGMSESEYVEKVSLHQKGWETLSARLSLELDVDGRKTHKLAGSLRVKRGEVIQLSLAPVLGIEIGRAEITPDGLLVIDRMNKRYVQLAYSELEEFSHVDLSYELLQALVLNEMFVPGESAWNERDFDFTVGASDVLWKVRKSKSVDYHYLTGMPDGCLEQSSLMLNGTPYGLDWKYSDFQTFPQGMFPLNMDLSFKGVKRPLSVTLDLNRLSVNEDWEYRLLALSKYQKIGLIDFLKILY